VIKYFSCFFFTFIAITALAVEHDSLVYLSDLNFINESETNAFISLKDKYEENDIVKILLTPYERKQGYLYASAQKKIDESVLVLQEKIKDKSESKKIKIIHQYVHEHFLKVYKLSNSFSDLFEYGYYNCVSGSALFAIILSKLEIPYQIIEAPTHVFLIAYPKQEKIVLESTIPDKGSYQFSKSIIERYIGDLYKSKLISKDEFEGSSATMLFEKYYFTSGVINIKELAGIQYSNFALYSLDEKKDNEALKSIIKSYYLNPSERGKYLLEYILFNTINSCNYSNKIDVDYLVILCRFYNANVAQVNLEVIKNEHARLIYTQLTENSNYENCKQFHNKIISSLKDTILIDELNFAYYYELSRLSIINGNDANKELINLEKAYKLKPKNANIQGFVLESFVNSVEKIDDAVKILETVNLFEKNFNFLDSNILFINAKANLYLELAYQNFYMSNIKKGDEFLLRCDSLKQQMPIAPDVEFVEKAYAEAASYYYKKGNYTKAKSYLKYGLSMAPNSFGLKQRINQIP
jgi:hypothetical protein